jgi:hypothetical protein
MAQYFDDKLSTFQASNWAEIRHLKPDKWLRCHPLTQKSAKGEKNG